MQRSMNISNFGISFMSKDTLDSLELTKSAGSKNFEALLGSWCLKAQEHKGYILWKISLFLLFLTGMEPSYSIFDAIESLVEAEKWHMELI